MKQSIWRPPQRNNTKLNTSVRRNQKTITKGSMLLTLTKILKIGTITRRNFIKDAPFALLPAAFSTREANHNDGVLFNLCAVDHGNHQHCATRSASTRAKNISSLATIAIVSCNWQLTELILFRMTNKSILTMTYLRV